MFINIERDNLNDIYRRLMFNLYFHGLLVNNTVELINVHFKLTNIDKCIVNIKDVKQTSIKYLLAENIWYATGKNSVKYISKYAKKWANISDNNKTSNSAYGYILRSKFGFNQIETVIDLLQKDKYSRRAVLILNDANVNIATTKDEQCTMYLQFLIRDEKLICIANMRSNDIYYGLPYDVPAFIAIQKYIAYRLSIEASYYYHNAGSLHVYNKQFNLMKNYNNLPIKPKYNINFVELYKQCIENNDIYNYAYNNDDLIKYCIKRGFVNEI